MQLIHQIALGHTIPALNRECLDSWRRLRPYGFEIVSWTDESVGRFLVEHASAETRSLCNNARNYGEASDILRMAIIHARGGLYVDWDVLLMDPQRFLAVMPDFRNSDYVLIRDPLTKEPNFASAYDNSLFYMRKGNALALEFWPRWSGTTRVGPCARRRI